MNIRFLINEDGSCFKSSEIKTLSSQLDALTNDERLEYRDKNASSISKNVATKILIVSGPGTGKSHLFLSRIDQWYQRDSQASVFVTSFVKKLVTDLNSDISNDDKLSIAQKSKITVLTLHKFARGIVEKNHGTSEWPFKPHFQIIGQFWKEVVWSDVLAFYPDVDKKLYIWKKFEEQLHNNFFKKSLEWQKLKDTYFSLCKFYNAAGFADLILRAKITLTENNSLNKDKYFIIDEYQDFNIAEDTLITKLVDGSNGILIAGDDEQVLYEKLKSGNATLIRNHYKDISYVNAMLPFCGRSSFHITKTASYFIKQNRENHCIEKIYLPLKTNDDKPKVQIIACATAPTAVDYIEKFVLDNKGAINERKEKLARGEETEAFLLILTPAKKVNFYGTSKTKIKQIVSEYQNDSNSFSEDYYKLISYYSLDRNPHNNFIFRKVLFYEGFTNDIVCNLINKAIREERSFCELTSEKIESVLIKCNKIKKIIDAHTSIDERINELSNYISIGDRHKLKSDIERQTINKDEIKKIEFGEEEEAELEELETKRMCAVELLTIIGSKGLSADHVIIIGFDDVNMSWVTKNAFYVAMTRARKSLHIITTLKSGGSKQAHNFLQVLPENHIDFFCYKKTGQTKNLLNGRQDFIEYIRKLNYVSRKLNC